MVRVVLPPLRDRPEDVRLLAHHFARCYTNDPAEIIDDEMDALLTSYTLTRSLEELHWEVVVRPDWIDIPIAGINRILSPPAENTDAGSTD